MARQWFGRDRRPAEASESHPVQENPEDAEAPDTVDADALEDEVEAEPVEEDVSGSHAAEDHTPSEPDGPGLAARLAAASGHAIARLGTGAIARLPAIGAAMLPRLSRLVATIAGGLLLCASFPSVNWWWAAVVAAALLAWVLKHPATTLAGGFGYGFLFGLAFYLPLLPWISLLVGAVPWLALGTMCALFPGLFGFFAIVLRRLPGWPIWFALVWAGQEWLKSVFPFGGFPWGAVAYGQAEGPLLPLVQLGGVALLSVGVMLLGFSATAIALEIAKWWRTGSRVRAGAPAEAAEDAAPPPPAVVLPGVCICLVLFAAVIAWPQVRHSGAGSGGDPTVTVAAVQGNVPRLGLGFNEQRRAVLDNHVAETLRLAENVRAGAAPQPQFVIWPEDSSDIDPFVNADAAQRIAEAAHAINAPILIGSVLAVPGRDKEPVEYTNTAIVWNPVSGPADRHDKEIVQPFGEYLPMPWLFKQLSGYAGLAGNFIPGKGSDVVHIGGVPVGVATCWEVIFDRVPRKAVLNGAQLLAVPANNATFNKRMSEQQLAFAKVRAVEHDRYVVVAGTTGISAVIAPDGDELVRTDFFQPAYLDIQVRLKTKLTPATQWSPIVQWVLLAAAGAVILAGIRHNRSFPRSFRHRSRPSAESADGGVAAEEPRSDEEAPTTAHDAPPDTAGDYTPLHQKGGPQPRYLGRHRGDK
ncbi:apolipoprotein N-acyltransferase [Mycobacterium montefiorense]|uniref:Apolipoprotein N-acyltransferase n=1 Tax=Mycobacterium montefiorense TaxID=154654 RepID=A0AA37UPS6_9MYCO|nr:hypothetical protein MmonteBS_36370 [Mycobacterium montefiorense]GKU37266.1 hypothetical protein NJB14191_46120 [Mycobacterium montefiorense]GKU41914.1 hypothetical protein NJB14192_38970 [Mycobacterium montefiorense]GKU45629.1 hypothetical protein NJB14194_22500 [Mycobacterium montefiorense]GKU53414.1 hypothetical protein NJB14195_46550 [Mycobacterium montefiorense]